MPSRRCAGWSLLELMVALTIAAILAVWAASAWSGYVARSRVLEAQAALDGLRTRMEAFFQDNRSYLDPATGACAVPAPTDVDGFRFQCQATATTYTWTASSDGTQGLGPSGSYVFSVDQDGNRTTSAFAGKKVALACWIQRPRATC